MLCFSTRIFNRHLLAEVLYFCILSGFLLLYI